MTLTAKLTLTAPDLDAAIEAPPGTVTALLGPSGAGKTSLALALAGLRRPISGRITLADQPLFDSTLGIDVPPHLRGIGIVFQDDRLFPHMTVAQNLSYSARFLRDTGEVAPLIALMGLQGLLDRRPATLSGGERRRAAIARALVAKPKALILDEPLSGIDRNRRDAVMPHLEALRDQTALPIILITHQADEVIRLADRIVTLADGRCSDAEPLEQVVSDPQSRGWLGAEFAGAILSGHAGPAGASDDGLCRVETPAGPLWLALPPENLGASLRLRLRADDLILARGPVAGLSALNQLPAQVTGLVPDGHARLWVRLRASEADLLARVTSRSAQQLALAPGQNCHAIVKTVALIAGG